MNHFFDRISQKAREPAEPAVVIAALGDSVTQGVMEHRFLEPGATYLRLLQQELEAFFPATTFNAINAGVSGDTAEGGRRRLSRDVTRYSPDLVLVAYGLNDSLKGTDGIPGFEKNLRGIVARLREACDADLLLVTPPFMATRSGSRIHPEHLEYADDIIRGQTEGVLTAYVEKIREMSATEHIALCDVHAEWERFRECKLDTDLWLSNGLNHPDQRGQRLAATVVFHTLLAQRVGRLT